MVVMLGPCSSLCCENISASVRAKLMFQDPIKTQDIAGKGRASPFLGSRLSEEMETDTQAYAERLRSDTS